MSTEKRVVAFAGRWRVEEPLLKTEEGARRVEEMDKFNFGRCFLWDAVERSRTSRAPYNPSGLSLKRNGQILASLSFSKTTERKRTAKKRTEPLWSGNRDTTTTPLLPYNPRISSNEDFRAAGGGVEVEGEGEEERLERGR
jgi:hypothetical protein